MTYGLSAYTQVSNFLSASGLGLLIALLYYLIAFVRSAVSERKIAYIISDTVFSVLCGFMLFVFFQVHTYGEVRWELIFSAAASFFVFRYCFKTLFSSLFEKGVRAFSLFLKAFFSPLTVLSVAVKKIFKKRGKKEK